MLHQPGFLVGASTWALVCSCRSAQIVRKVQNPWDASTKCEFAAQCETDKGAVSPASAGASSMSRVLKISNALEEPVTTTQVPVNGLRGKPEDS